MNPNDNRGSCDIVLSILSIQSPPGDAPLPDRGLKKMTCSPFRPG